MFFSVILPLALITIMFFAQGYLKRKTKHINHQINLQKDFFAASDALIKDDDTGIKAILVLSYLGDNISNPRITRRALKAAMGGRLREIADDPNNGKAFIDGLEEGLSEPLKQQLHKAFASFMLANTFSSYIAGPIVRRFMLYSLRYSPASAEIIIKNIDNKWKNNGDLSHA